MQAAALATGPQPSLFFDKGKPMQPAIGSKERFTETARICFNLLNSDKAPQAVLYIVFKTIESNPGITLNQLRWLLQTEFLMPQITIDFAVGALTSRSLFAAVTKWQQPGGNKDVITLRVRESSDVKEWEGRYLSEYPEMSTFIPPLFRKKKSSAP